MKLAVDGGRPVRDSTLPYGRQTIDESDIKAVVDVLQSDWLTTGPAVPSFESAFADFVGAREAVAVNSGTAALHAMLDAQGVGPGDEVIVPAITFAATANAALYLGATPVFADIDEGTMLIDPPSVAQAVTGRTRAIIAVDYAGQPADYDALGSIATDNNLSLMADACHAIGGSDRERPVGTLAHASSFSFHPVKHMTTAEGGMVTTNDKELATKIRWFRNHGITSDHGQRAKKGTWSYDMVDLGYNYRLSDLQCALGEAQLPRLKEWVQRRQAIAAQYDAAFAEFDTVSPLSIREDVSNAYHLYVVKLEVDRLTVGRDVIFDALRAEGIGVNVHYKPVYQHSYYRQLGYQEGLCPKAERLFERILSLPVFPTMSDQDINDVVDAMRKVTEAFRK
jgi:perosamine synthetase